MGADCSRRPTRRGDRRIRGDLADAFESVEDGGAPGTTVVGLAGQVQEGRAVHPPQIEQAVVAKLGEAFLDFRDLLAQARVIVIKTIRLRMATQP